MVDINNILIKFLNFISLITKDYRRSYIGLRVLPTKANYNYDYKNNLKGSRDHKKSKETSSKLSYYEITGYPLYKLHWLIFVSVHTNLQDLIATLVA